MLTVPWSPCPRLRQRPRVQRPPVQCPRVCELAGLGLAVREYLAALQHHGHLADARRRLTQVWGAIVARWRRFRGRPAGVVHAEAHSGITIEAP
jgi:hypothetical protein